MLLKVYMAFGKVTTVDSATVAVAAGTESAGDVCAPLTTGTDAGVLAGVLDDAAGVTVPAESAAVTGGLTGAGGGNSTWDIAMTMSERNSARKKRLSIREPDRSRQA